MSHIQLNYAAFLLFWKNFVEIHWKILFLIKKFLSQKEAQKYLNFFFLNKFEKGQILSKFGFV